MATPQAVARSSRRSGSTRPGRVAQSALPVVVAAVPVPDLHRVARRRADPVTGERFLSGGHRERAELAPRAGHAVFVQAVQVRPSRA